MSDERDRERLEQLLADFASGEISGVDARALEVHLQHDPSARDELRALLRLDGFMRSLSSERASDATDAVDVLMRQIEARTDDDPGLLSKIESRIKTPLPRLSVAQRRGRKRRRALWGVVAGAVAVAAALLLAVTMSGSGPVDRTRATRVIALGGGARIGRAGDTVAARVGSWVEPGDAVTSDVGGSLRMRYVDGTELTLGGGTSLEVSDGTLSKSLALRAGELAADVAKQPAGLPLVARTRECVVKVLGTRLTLTAGPGESLVSVEEGAVVVHRIADGDSVRVSGGQYVIVGRGGGELAVVPVGMREEDDVKARDVARVLGGAALALTAGVASAQGVSVKVEPVGAVYGLVEVDAPKRGEKPEAVVLRVTVANNAAHPIREDVVLTASDMFGRDVAWSERVAAEVAPGRSVNRDVEMRTGWGFYVVRGSTGDATCEAEVGIVPRHTAGIRKNSFFASNTSNLKSGDELKLLQMIGMKVQRAHFQPHVRDNATRRPPTGGPLPLDLEGKAREFENAKKHETWVLPLTGYAFEGAKSKLANETGMHGPPRDFDEWVKSWELIVRRFPEIETYEFWNEPWIFGWTWAAPPEDYRKLQAMWCKMALKVNPKLRIIAGNSSMFVTDHIEPYAESWKGLLHGTTHHPYCYSTSQPTFRSGESVRSIDDGMETTRRMGLPYYYLTEGGTWYKDPVNGIINARKIVHYHIQTALTGCFQANAQFGIGIGNEWTRSNHTYAVMTHFLEDRPVVAEIWPENELLWGAVFANPRHVTSRVRSLPRAAELAARWKVDVPVERKADDTKVAVVWSFTGESCDEIDTEGTLTIGDASGLAAYDMTGQAIEARDGELVLPFTEDPVYVTTDTLDVVTLRNRIANARVEQVTPVNLYALSLQRPGDESQTLTVRIENQMNCTINGQLHLQIAGESGEKTTMFAVAGGQLEEVEIEWAGVDRSAHRQYAVQLTAECRRLIRSGTNRRSVEVGVVSREQLVQTARFVKKTVRIDGTLRDWEGVTPVLLDSRALKKDLDMTRYLLNPHLARVTGEDADKRVVARVYTAYDDSYVYLAAAVNEETHSCSAGQPIQKGKAKLPYRNGMPDGLSHITLCGDVFSFGFGFRERVPGHGRQMDDPWRWKGFIRDTDYHYVAHSSTDGDMLVRQWGPDTDRRNAYQCDDIPHVGAVRGARIKIARDEKAKLTTYEIAIPRSELRLFDPSKKSCRFAFILYNNDKVGGGSMHWTEAAGVFDHWRNSGSFGPSWNYVLPCQTFFAIDR